VTAVLDQVDQAPPPPLTTRPPRTLAPYQQRLRRTGLIRATDYLAMFGALAAGLTMSGLLWTELSPFTGLLGYVVTSWLLFVAFYALLISFDENRPTVRDRIASVVVHSLAAVMLTALIFISIYIGWNGWHAMIHANFWTQDLRSTGPLDPLTRGGIKHAVVGTLIEVGIAMTLAVPLGLLGAVFLHEIRGRFSRFVRTVVEAMTALPDILAGLFIYATLILILGWQLSGLAAATALGVTVLPIIIRTGDVVLRLVPGGLKEASYALGTGQWRTVRHILLPTARSGLVTAVILGAARAIGETSPILLTAGVTGYTNVDPLHGPMMSLPLLAYIQMQSSQKAEIARGFGTATTLLLLVILLFGVARILGGRGPGQLTSGQQRRRAAQSQRDIRRMGAHTQRVKGGTPS
jgi:phosphate transport system permease protein